MKRLPRHTALVFCALLGLGTGASSPAWAVYKIVGPDGAVTFSDTPPSSGKDKIIQVAPAGGSSPSVIDALPQPLRGAAREYPATLYTTPRCGACDAGRELLQQRGIPYTEKTVTTEADMRAYKHIAGVEDRLPLLTLGSTKLPIGFSQGGWDTALDAAGYPKHTELPRSYSPPQPTSLAPAAPPKPRPGSSGPEESGLSTTPVLPPPNPKAPPGFQF